MKQLRASFRILLLLPFIIILLLLTACQNDNYPYFIRTRYPIYHSTFDPGTLCVAISNWNQVVIINRFEDKITGYYDVGVNPSRTAVDSAGNCYVGCRGHGGILYGTVYGITTAGATNMYSGFDAPRGVALDKYGNVWIANSGDGSIQKINADGTIDPGKALIGGYFYASIVDTDGYLYIADRPYRLIKYDTSMFPDATPASYTSVNVSIYGFTMDFDGKLWASSMSGSLTKIDSETMTVENTYTISLGSSSATTDAFNKIWIANYDNPFITRFDPVTETSATHEVQGDNPHGVGADERGYVYSVNLGSGTVSKIDADPNRSLGSIVTQYDVGGQPYCYSDMTGFLYRKITLNQ